MKWNCGKSHLLFLICTALLSVPVARGQESQKLEDLYPILSPSYNVPGSDETHFPHLNFRFAWTNAAPLKIAIQLANPTYGDQKIKFAIKDLTTGQTVQLDEEHNAYFINETLHPNQEGSIWFGDVNSLSDQFALKVWDNDGDAFQQEPVTLMSAWTQKPRPVKIHRSPSPTPTYTKTMVPTVTRSPVPGATPLPTSTPTWTMTSSETPTPTDTVTTTDTATPCQTPAPFFKCSLVFFGDSFSSRNGYRPGDRNFKGLTIESMQKWYPGLQTTDDDVMIREGCDPGCWAHEIHIWLDWLAKSHKDIPIGYFVFETGDACFYYAPAPDHDGCKGASVSQGVSISYIYQEKMDETLQAIYAQYPAVHLVVTGIADTTGGAGHFAPPEVYQAFNQRLYELKAKYPRMRIADIYPLIGNHSEYFMHTETMDNDHPTFEGHALYAKCVLDQFSYWPYHPKIKKGRRNKK